MLGFLISNCCCDPCEAHALDFNTDGVFTVSPLTVGDTTGWEVSGGTLNLTGTTADSVTWTVPTESKPGRAFFLRVEFDILDLGADSGGVFIYAGAKLVALYKSNAGDILLVYGTKQRVIAAYNGSGTRVWLQLTPTECGTVIGWEVENNGRGSIRTFEIELADFGAPDADFDMGVLGLPGPASTEDTDCCPTEGWPSSMSAAGSLSGGASPCSPDSCSVTGAQTFTATTATLDGGNEVPIGDRYWRGNVPISGLGGGSEGVVWCDGGTPRAFLINSGTGAKTQDLTLVSSGCDPFSLVFDVDTSECCLDGVIPTKRITFSASGGGTATNTFDNGEFTACGDLPTEECDPFGEPECFLRPGTDLSEPPDAIRPTVAEVYRMTGQAPDPTYLVYLFHGDGRPQSECYEEPAPGPHSGCWLGYRLDDPAEGLCDESFSYNANLSAGEAYANVAYDDGTDELVFEIVFSGATWQYRTASANFATAFTVAFTATMTTAPFSTITVTPIRRGEA